MADVPVAELLSLARDGHAEMAAQVMQELEAEHDAKPSEVFYELREDPYWDEEGKVAVMPVREERFEHAPGTLWERVAWLADLLTRSPLCRHPDVYQVRVYTSMWIGRETRREETYVMSRGGQWRDETGHLHQVGSGGFCWDCLQPDPDLSIAQRGLIRHPVTPGELGNPPYACLVCKLDTTAPNMMHELTDHTVIWGEEAHPRCETCGLGYQTANPGGIGYTDHVDVCPELRPEKLREHLRASHKGVPAYATYQDGRNDFHLFGWHQQWHASFPGQNDHSHAPEAGQ